jgi:hypothetical protein
MPLSSSRVDERNPEALSTSRESEISQRGAQAGARPTRCSGRSDTADLDAAVGIQRVNRRVDRQSLRKVGGAMEMEVKEQTETSYVFNVTLYTQVLRSWKG